MASPSHDAAVHLLVTATLVFVGLAFLLLLEWWALSALTKR
jgi:hypothetical protein